MEGGKKNVRFKTESWTYLGNGKNAANHQQ